MAGSPAMVEAQLPCRSPHVASPSQPGRRKLGVASKAPGKRSKSPEAMRWNEVSNRERPSESTMGQAKLCVCVCVTLSAYLLATDLISSKEKAGTRCQRMDLA